LDACCRKGGCVGFSAFGVSAFQPISDLFEARIRAYGVTFPLPKHPFSWQRLTSLEQCGNLLADAGLEQIEVREEQLGYYLRDTAEWWRLYGTVASEVQSLNSRLNNWNNSKRSTWQK